MFAEDVAYTSVAIVSNSEVELYVVNMDKWCGTHGETSQWPYRKYQHSWNTAQPNILMDLN